MTQTNTTQINKNSIIRIIEMSDEIMRRMFDKWDKEYRILKGIKNAKK